jgi:hypothetical protein
MELFVVLTVESGGIKGTFAGTSPPVQSREEAFQWAWPLALNEIDPFGQDGAAVMFFSATPEGSSW